MLVHISSTYVTRSGTRCSTVVGIDTGVGFVVSGEAFFVECGRVRQVSGGEQRIIGLSGKHAKTESLSRHRLDPLSTRTLFAYPIILVKNHKPVRMYSYLLIKSVTYVVGYKYSSCELDRLSSQNSALQAA